MDEPLRFSPRSPSAAVVGQGRLLATSALALPHFVTVRTRYSHRRSGRICAPVAPTPCPTRRAECWTATVRVVHPVAFLLAALLSVHSTSCRLAGICELVAALVYL